MPLNRPAEGPFKDLNDIRTDGPPHGCSYSDGSCSNPLCGGPEAIYVSGTVEIINEGAQSVTMELGQIAVCPNQLAGTDGRTLRDISDYVYEDRLAAYREARAEQVNGIGLPLLF